VKKDDKGNIILDPGKNTGSIKPLIWVANSGEGTVSKVDAETLVELARYQTYPAGQGDPSRSTVSLNGDAVVIANRAYFNGPRTANIASAVKIAAGDKTNGYAGCVDRNRNGKIDTFEGSGPVPAAFQWPAGQKDSPDECVVWLTHLANGATHPIPRAAGFDAEQREFGGFVYIGLFGAREVVRLDSKTGAIVKRISVPGTPYGLVIDKDGVVWVQGSGPLVKIEVQNNDKVTSFSGNRCPYGITADARGYIYTAASNCISRFNPKNDTFETYQVPGASSLRGVAVDDKNHAWIAETGGRMFHVDVSAEPPPMGQTSTMKVMGSSTVGGGNVGAAIDYKGRPWVISQSQATAYRLDPTKAGANYMPQGVKVGASPYTYSDMTGYQLRNAGAPFGRYIQTFAGCGPQTRWYDLEFQLSAPTNTEAIISVRFGNTQQELAMAMWTQVAKLPPPAMKIDLSKFVPSGKGGYLQVLIEMRSAKAGESPILSGLSAGYSCPLG
jgi:hypothetical protein